MFASPQFLRQVGQTSVRLSGRLRAAMFMCGLILVCGSARDGLAQDAAESEGSESTMYDGPMQPPDWQLSEWRQYRLPYTQARRAERPSAEERRMLTRGVEYYLYSMTQVPELPEPEEDEPPDTLIDLRTKLLSDLRQSITKDGARQHMLAEIVRISKELLNQPPAVRLNIAILLASLSTTASPEDPRPYEPAHEVLLTILNDPDQPVQCKIWAAKGFGRIGRDGNPNVTIRSRMAVALAQALDSPEAQQSDNWWYRMRLIDALGDIGKVDNLNRQPIIIDALMQILASPDEHWVIRSTAARAVSQLELEANTNLDLVVYEVGRLTHQMAQAYNQQLARRNNQEDPYWRYSFLNLYLTFHARELEERQRGWGLMQQVNRGLGQYRNRVEQAYQVILPIVNSVMTDRQPQQIPQQVISNLDQWLQDNLPNNRKVTPASEELKDRGSPQADPTASSATPSPASRTVTADAARIRNGAPAQ